MFVAFRGAKGDKRRHYSTLKRASPAVGRRSLHLSGNLVRRRQVLPLSHSSAVLAGFSKVRRDKRGQVVTDYRQACRLCREFLFPGFAGERDCWLLPPFL